MLYRYALPLVTLFISQSALAALSVDGVWSDDESGLSAPSSVDPNLQHFRLLRLDRSPLTSIVAQLRAAQPDSGIELSVPLPDGSFERFRLSLTDVVPPVLAARYPEVTTFAGVGIDTPTAWGRFDWGPLGFHGYVQREGQTIYVNPQDAAGDSYISFNRSDLQRPAPDYFLQHTTDFIRLTPPGYTAADSIDAPASTGPQLRTFRLAVAATGEYTQYHGGTVLAGHNAIASAVNRVSGIYERDFAVRLQLIDNNDLLIYTNSATDPYTNSSASTLLSENQSNLDTVIGSANYDIGHVFSTGGGGLAYLGVVCSSNYKARGETGSPAPTGDPFWVDYVAHEMGHQFGANHTFNGTQGSCGGGNRNASTAYEPGSGTTIMAYAGICGSDDLQSNSDDHMHAASISEITSYLGTVSCGTTTSTGNSAPSVSVASPASLTLPKSTPFALTASATDPNGQSLTYGWEEMDLGAAGAPSSPSGDAPIFRSFSPVSSATRTFPRLAELVNNTAVYGELLPTYGRNLNFRVTVRDGYGGVNSANASYTVTDSAGPFLVTAPNTAVTVSGGSSYNVTWNVAGTASAPVSCANVNISLSSDGGFTYPYSLASATPNDGAQSVTIPSISTTTARIKVACATSVFFDISDANFTVNGSSCSGGVVTVPDGTTFPAGTTNCVGTTSITTSGSVTVPNGATVNFTAPQVDLNPGFHAEQGSSFHATQ